MQQNQFDSFGERVTIADVQTAGAQQAGSRRMRRFIVGLFWLLVVAVVAARVIYAVPAS